MRQAASRMPERGAPVGGGVLHVGHGDHATGARGRHAGEVDLHLLRQRAHGRYGLDATGARDLLGVHGVAADHGADDGAFVFALCRGLAVGFDLAAVVGGDDLGRIIRCRAADALLRAVVVTRGFGFGTLAGVRIDFEVSQRRAGFDDVTDAAVQFLHGAGERRRHVDDGLRGFHRHQRGVELDGVAFLDVPLDDGRVGQAFAEVRQVKGLDVGHVYRFLRRRRACAGRLRRCVRRWAGTSFPGGTAGCGYRSR